MHWSSFKVRSFSGSFVWTFQASEAAQLTPFGMLLSTRTADLPLLHHFPEVPELTSSPSLPGSPGAPYDVVAPSAHQSALAAHMPFRRGLAPSSPAPLATASGPPAKDRHQLSATCSLTHGDCPPAGSWLRRHSRARIQLLTSQKLHLSSVSPLGGCLHSAVLESSSNLPHSVSVTPVSAENEHVSTNTGSNSPAHLCLQRVHADDGSRVTGRNPHRSP